MAWYYDRFPKKLTVGERAAEARAVTKSLEKKGKKLEPVVIEGNTISSTFWGKAWCAHLETYSDYESRLPRGRSYARNGSVIDLKLEPGSIRALVSGSSLYTIEIDVRPLALDRWKTLVRECSGKIDSVVGLLTGKLPDSVMHKLCDPKTGLFPAASHLEMSCSCPDSAELCKHLAAVLYGVGARLDHQPELLFVLRGVDQFDLVGEAAAKSIATQKRAANELRSDELADIFGIELALEPKRKSPARKARR